MKPLPGEMPGLLIRWSGPVGILVGLLYFLGYASMAELLTPVVSPLGGHVILGCPGTLTLFVLVGVTARDSRQSGLTGLVGYALPLLGATVFSAGNLAEGIWPAGFGTRLFAVGLIGLTAGVVVFGIAVLRVKALPACGVLPLVTGWPAFLPIANSPSYFGFARLGASLLAAGVLGIGWVTLDYALWSAGRDANGGDRGVKNIGVRTKVTGEIITDVSSSRLRSRERP